MKERTYHIIPLFLLLFAALFLMPGTAQGAISKTYESYYCPNEATYPFGSFQYAEAAGGKVAVTVSLNYNTFKGKSTLKIYAIENGTVIAEMAPGSDFSSSNPKYTFKHTFASGAYVGFYAADAEIFLSDEEVKYEAEYFDNYFYMPTVEKNPLDDITNVGLADGLKKYSGQFQGIGKVKVYKLQATQDAALTIKNFTTSSGSGCLGLFYFEDEMKKLYPDRGQSRIYANQGNTIAAGMAGKSNGGEYYIVMDAGSSTATWSFDMEFRKYRHAYVELKVQEGDLEGAFPQNTTLHFTATLSPSNTDARFTSSSSVTNPGSQQDADNFKASADGKSATFTIRTKYQAQNTEYTLNYTELNPENISEYYGTTGTGMSKDFSVTTGLSAMQLSPEVGYNFIRFSNFNIPEFGQGSTANIAVYLKSGKKWKKKFSVPAYSKTTKTIKKLKSSKKYTFKTVITKQVNGGKTVKTENKYTVKTGPKSAPPIKSVKVSNVKVSTYWVRGWWDSSWHWHSGHWSTSTSYKITVTLKKKVKGAVGMDANGLRSMGKGKTFTFSGSQSGNAKGKTVKYTFRMVTNKKYGGYSKAVTKKLKLN